MPRRCHPAGPWRHALELYEITNTNEVPQPLGIFGRHTDAAVTDSGLSGAGIGSFAATRNDHSKARSSVQKKPLRALLSLKLCVARFPISVKELELT